MWNFGLNSKVSSWCDNLKKQKKSEKVFFFGLRRIFIRKHVFLKIKTVEDVKFWFKLKSFVLMWRFAKQEKSVKYIFSAYDIFLAEKHVLFKSNPLKMWNFGLNLKVLSWCDDLEKQEKSEKVNLFGLRRIFSQKHVFLKIKTVEDLKFWYKQISYV